MTLIIDTCMALWNRGFKGNIVKIGLATLLLGACVSFVLIAASLPVFSHEAAEPAVVRPHVVAFRHKPPVLQHAHAGLATATPISALIVTPIVSDGIESVSSNNTSSVCRAVNTVPQPQATATVQMRVAHKATALSINAHILSSLPPTLGLPVTPTEGPIVSSPTVPSTPVAAPIVTITTTPAPVATTSVSPTPNGTAVTASASTAQGDLTAEPTAVSAAQTAPPSPTEVPTSVSSPVIASPTPTVSVTATLAVPTPTAVVLPTPGERPHISYLYYQRLHPLNSSIDCLSDSVVFVQPVAGSGIVSNIMMGISVLGTLSFFISISVVLRRVQKGGEVA